MFRKHYKIRYEPGISRSTVIIEERSIPWAVWLIENWFFWAHEWLFYINKRLHYKLMYPFCAAYDIIIMHWAFGQEQIEGSEEFRNVGLES